MSRLDKKIEEITTVLDKFGDEKIRPNMDKIAVKVFDVMSKDRTKYILVGFAIGFILATILGGIGVGTGVIGDGWGNQVQ
jgi:hypothetical protein